MAKLMDRLNDYLLLNTKVPLTAKVFFTENLKVMVHAGLSISEALGTLALQAESKTFRKVITMVKNDVESGKPLSKSMGKFVKIFPPIFVSMIEIGEVSGTLEDVLTELTQQMKKDYELRSKVKGAMTYPIVVCVAMLGITIGLVTVVLPKLLGVFKEFGDVQLPLATRVLIVITDFVQNNGILTAVAAVVIVAGLVAFFRTKTGTYIFDKGVLTLPIISPIARKVNLARFSRTVSGLLKSDIPVVQSFTVTSQVVANVHYRDSLLDVAERIKKGEPISKSLGLYPKLYPPLVVQMVNVGERSGTVDELLGDIAGFYEQQVDQTLDNLSSIIEPILILMLGGMVGGIALAVITPIFTLTQSISEGG